MTPTNPGPWLIPGITQRLIELHALSGEQAMTMSAIAKQLSVEFDVKLTTNACIGRKHRLRLANRPTITDVRGKKPMEKANRSHTKVDAPIAPLEAERLSEDNALTIYQLRDGDCKWPFGAMLDRPPFFYCGKAAVREGSPWCPEHYARCHVKARLEWE
jgi:hypothetical protein